MTVGKHLAPARTFKPRRRSLSPRRAVAFAAALRRWGLGPAGPVLDLAAVFACGGPYVLDIGFGGGEALVELARLRSDECVIGVKVHTPGLAFVLGVVEALGMNNVRIVDGDALELLDRLESDSLHAIRLFFPDPWPKRKQRHRRIVRPDVVAALVDRLRPGGVLHLATDIADYAQQMEIVCAGDGRLVGGVVDRPPWRPVTRFEARGLAAGRESTDLWYVRRADRFDPS